MSGSPIVFEDVTEGGVRPDHLCNESPYATEGLATYESDRSAVEHGTAWTGLSIQPKHGGTSRKSSKERFREKLAPLENATRRKSDKSPQPSICTIDDLETRSTLLDVKQEIRRSYRSSTATQSLGTQSRSSLSDASSLDGQPGKSTKRFSLQMPRKSDGGTSPSERSDNLRCFSAVLPETKQHDGHDSHARRPGFPLPLMAFVTMLSAVAGFVVVAFSTAIVYAGCPLGINGCNEFYNKEDKGFKLIKALEGSVPEEVVYIVLSALGALFIVQLCAHLPQDLAFQVSGGGTLQSLEAVAFGNVVPIAAAALRFLVSVVYSGSGGPLGMEGPAIQICTSLATNAGWALGIRAAPTQAVLASLGFAAGFAASFNSPLAGILFAMEELQHITPQFSRGMEVMVLVVSIVPTIIYRACKGNSQHFVPKWEQQIKVATKGGSLDQVFGKNLWMLITIPIALMCSIMNLLIILGLRHGSRALEMIHKRFEWLPITVTFIFQAIIIACMGAGIFRLTGLRGIWGIGAESVQDALSKDFATHEYFLFGFAKSLAMIIAVSSRAPGDVLEPVLISGAFLGGGVGRCLIDLLGYGTEVMTPTIIFGMVGLFASCMRFQLTPVVIVIELMGTEAYELILPMVLASFTAVIVSSRLCPPILAEIMHQDGLDLHDTKDSEAKSEAQVVNDDPHSPRPKLSRQKTPLKTLDQILQLDKLGGMIEASFNDLAHGELDSGFNCQVSPETDSNKSADSQIGTPRTPSIKSAWGSTKSGSAVAHVSSLRCVGHRGHVRKHTPTVPPDNAALSPKEPVEVVRDDKQASAPFQTAEGG